MKTYKQSDRGTWGAQAEDNDGNMILGQGLTEKQAIRECQEGLDKSNAFIALPAHERLGILTDQKYINARNVEECLRCINEILSTEVKSESKDMNLNTTLNKFLSNADLGSAKDITCESYREYDIPGRSEPYRIDNPQTLYCGATTHRVVDKDGVVHCVPAPGKDGCVLRWSGPVEF